MVLYTLYNIPTDSLIIIINLLSAYDIACLYMSSLQNLPFLSIIKFAIEHNTAHDISHIYKHIYNFEIEEEIEYDEYIEFNDDSSIWYPVNYEEEYEEEYGEY